MKSAHFLILIRIFSIVRKDKAISGWEQKIKHLYPTGIDSRGTMLLGRRGSDSHLRLSFTSAPSIPSEQKNKSTFTLRESILAARCCSVVAALTAV